MKIDTHVHSLGISKCSRVTYQEIAQNKLKAGYNGAVLTNHCQPWYYTQENYKEWIEEFITEFKNAYEYGKEIGFTFFLGIEISINDPRWADFLYLGVTEEFLRNAPDMCKASQSEIFKYCEKYGVLMIQAHPFRPNIEPLNPKFMHGVEINCSLSDIHNRWMVEEFAKINGLPVTVGTDYHLPYPGDVGGIIVPDGIENSVQLAKYLKGTRQIKLFIGEEEILSKGFSKQI